MARIVVLAPIPPGFLESQLEEHDLVYVDRDENPALAVRDADIVIADYTSHHRVAGEVVDALAPTCRLVQVPAAGLDSVDLAACAAAGILVAGTPGANSGTVAEWCVWAALSALRAFVTSERELRSGRWDQLGRARYELDGKLVGIVGMGAIGAEVARRMAAFGVELRYWTRSRRPPEVENDLGIDYESLDVLIATADVLVLVIALADETHHLIDAERLAAMKPTAVVVNASRGAVVDEQALADALRNGRLHGAAVDVYGVEPPPPDHPLLGCDNAVTTPHVAGATAESIVRIIGRSLDNVRRALAGEEPRDRAI